MVLEFTIEEKAEEGKVRIYNDKEKYGIKQPEYLFKSKIVLLTMNCKADLTGTSLLEILMKGNHHTSNKQKNIEKFLFLTLDPTPSKESYKAVSDTLAPLRRMQSPMKPRTENVHKTPINEVDSKDYQYKRLKIV